MSSTRGKEAEKMFLDLTEDERNHVRVTYNAIRFEVNFGKDNTMQREYFTVDDMMNEFEENGIEKADFDEEAHQMYTKGLQSLSEDLGSIKH
jgi:hypothetical protein